jgi:hypothetical protein
MTETLPDLESRVEDTVIRVFRDAFPSLSVWGFTQPGEREKRSIGISVVLGAENPIGTKLYDVAIEIETRNLNSDERQLVMDMVGTAHAAKETLSIYSASSFAMPSGQPVEMIGAPRTVENEGDRIVTYSLAATIQPI